MDAFSIWIDDSVSKMFDFLSLFPDFGHRTDTHFQMHVDEFGIHRAIHFLVLIPSGINGMSETRSSAPREILFA